MSHERPDVVYYDSGTNIQFADALVDSIVVPAVFAALDKDRSAGLTGDVVADDEEVWDQGNRTGYEFLADLKDNSVTIISTAYMGLSDLSASGAQLLHDDLQMSHMTNDEVRDRYQNDARGLQEAAIIETFTRRTFQVRLSDDTNSVRVETKLGYSIDGHEVVQGIIHEKETSLLDLERDTVFELSELLEIIRALLALELVDQADVRRFLELEF